MVQSSASRADPGSTQPDEPTLDLGHLRRMTLGDLALEREVLRLFDQQTAMLAERLCNAPATVAAASAHTLKGSARGIGAWRLARAAEQVERAVASGEPEWALAVADLVGAVAATRAAIAKYLLN